MIYSSGMTLGEARAEYFRLNGFGEDGGYKERWIKVKIWRLPVWLPNTPGRRRAVRLHDLHHVLTEYSTTWRGEAEISAWEIGSGGLNHFYAGWWLDLMNVAQGLVINPQGVYSGFMRGRRTTNLYRIEFNDALLKGRVGEYRQRLLLDAEIISPGLSDYVMLVFWVTVSVLIYIASVGSGTLPLIALGWLIWGL